MTASSAPQSSGCAPSTLLLQRRLLGRDSAKWRTVCRLSAAQRGRAEQLARLGFGLDPQTEWRIVPDAPDMICSVGEDGHAYVSLTEHEALRLKHSAFRRCISRIADAFALLELESQNGWREMNINPEPPDWAAPTEPAPLGD